ncbi:MAG: hypothetical protein JO194_01150 [Candidatus Eremiobacteraeota bacterium]|nr:hypothetical protein [Candidatus Eremiobacteraeota bacterium]
MSLELINTVGSLLTACIIAATAIVAIVQLRHLRASNQISAMLNIGEELRDPEFTRALHLIRTQLDSAVQDPLFRAYSDAWDHGDPLPDVPESYEQLRNAATLVGNAYEELGILVKNGIVDRHLFLDRYSWTISNAWGRLALVTADSRAATGQQALWENFEYLAVLSEDWIRDHGSVYPKGVRRMPLRPSAAPDAPSTAMPAQAPSTPASSAQRSAPSVPSVPSA